MQEILFQIRYFERGLSESLKKGKVFFFLSNRLPLNGWNYQRQRGSGTREKSLFRLQNKFKNIILFVIYYLSKFDDVMWSSYCVIPKITSANLCKSIDDIIINYSTCICPFESGNCGENEKKLQKYEYLENEKSFLDEIKSIFHSFLRAIIWWKNKKLISCLWK